MDRGPELRAVGDRAVLVEVADNDRVQSLSMAVRARWGVELAEVVPGARTLLLVWQRSRPPLDRIRVELDRLARVRHDEPQAKRLVVPVRYDGPDLQRVAEVVGVGPESVIELHTGAEYRVAFIGFAPGFGYLIGGDPKLDVPRRSSPRQRVPAGSVAIAAGYSAVYPTSAPGGWQILGHTELVMFTPDRDPPALLEPGTRVTFKAV